MLSYILIRHMVQNFFIQFQLLLADPLGNIGNLFRYSRLLQVRQYRLAVPADFQANGVRGQALC